MAWSRGNDRGYGGAWAKLRIAVMRRDRNLCQPCLKINRHELATEVDHIVPKSKGGTDAVDNLQAICTSCHREKTMQESAEARGVRLRRRVVIGPDGWPVA